MIPRLTVVLLTLLVAPSCGGEKCSDKPVTDACLSAERRSDCLREGGCWGAHGLTEVSSCLCPTRDAGTECADAQECEGYCIADVDEAACEAVTQGVCSEFVTVYGCNCMVRAPQSASDEPSGYGCYD